MRRAVVINAKRVSNCNPPMRTHNLIFRQCGNQRLPHSWIHPEPSRDTRNNVNAQHSLIRNLWYDNCDKNFMYFSLFPHNFPGLRSVYLNSHPGEPNVLRRFYDHQDITIYLTEHHRTYKRRWADDMGNVRIIPYDGYLRKLNRCLHDADIDSIQL